MGFHILWSQVEMVDERAASAEPSEILRMRLRRK